MSDGAQSLTFSGFHEMMDDLEPYLALRYGTRRACLRLVNPRVGGPRMSDPHISDPPIVAAGGAD